MLFFGTMMFKFFRVIEMGEQFIGKCFCLITGASSGFGRALAQLMVKENGLLQNASEGSKIVFLARNMAGMEETRSLMSESGKNMQRFLVEFLPVDLSESTETEIAIQEYIGEQDTAFDHLFLFNNAGVLGNISGGFVDCTHNILHYQKLFNINMTSPMFLISKFLKYFKDSNRVVVQTSSLAAIKPCPSMSTYCAAKAGMDMFMRCLTLDHPDVTTLSYSPGPIDTPIGQELADNHHLEETRAFWKNLRTKDEIVKPMDSAQILLDVLQAWNFKSGDFVDYFGRSLENI